MGPIPEGWRDAVLVPITMPPETAMISCPLTVVGDPIALTGTFLFTSTALEPCEDTMV